MPVTSSLPGERLQNPFLTRVEYSPVTDCAAPAVMSLGPLLCWLLVARMSLEEDGGRHAELQSCRAGWKFSWKKAPAPRAVFT